MSLDLEEARLFIQQHLPTALVVGFFVCGTTYVVTDKLQERQMAFLNAQIQSLRQDTENIEKLKTKVKELEARIELFEEQRRRKDELLPSIARFDPKKLYTPSPNATVVELANAKQ
ncbi:hypothetical protein [Methylibium rhizosphaerae]|uniref:hypothetical protein n=1 Tax=Methylibium rhizosphaerae TaxID=2570323 RepID=UPI001128E535|nr:hypothetical protein [Methylibium rhizosphaerae]